MTSSTPSTKHELNAQVIDLLTLAGLPHPDEDQTTAQLTMLLVACADQYARAVCEEVIEDATNIGNTNCATDHLEGDGCTTEDHHYRSGRFDAVREIEERAEAKLNELLPKGEE